MCKLTPTCGRLQALLAIVTDLSTAISRLAVREFLLVPGGWLGLTSAGTLMHLVERTSLTEYSFTLCNTGGQCTT